MKNEIRAGVQGKYLCENYTILLIYSTEFVRRLGGRKIDPLTAFNKLSEAFPKLLEYADSQPKSEVIIKSKSLDLNIVVSISSNQCDKMNLLAETIMVKDDFIVTKMRDYELEINPPVKVCFEPGANKFIKYFVMRDLATRRIHKGFYHFDSGIVNYMIDYEGYIGVPHAEWSVPMFEINVK